MKLGGRISAAIHVLDEVLARRQPVRLAVRDWGKRARYAGAKDRAWVSGLVLDALRRKNSLASAMGAGDPRALVLGTLAFAWQMDPREIEMSAYEPHGPTPLSDGEREALAAGPDISGPLHVRGDFPEWLTAHMTRAFGENAADEGAAMAQRAPVDIRVNTLKADAQRAARALAPAGARASALLRNGLQIPAPDPREREKSLEAIPAYSKGWVEVQDAGSQIAAAAAGLGAGEQVLDFCAGGGGKTLAMAGAMAGKGQVFAHDIDARRLSALIPRLKRSVAHNVQLVYPDTSGGLAALEGQMDCVFLDAPCSGTGTWRRKPDTKWRLSAKALQRRVREQADILRAGAAFVKPGGRLVYVTCSILIEEGEDRVGDFLSAQPEFRAESAADAAISSGLLTEAGARAVRAGEGAGGGVRLTPFQAGTDGFFFAVLRRAR
ncbi:MAG: MFS transporter [Alphaproteobacteria bacterium]|jgi:16S rRNA (cytosine967-C5)-methyltransferase|nr:MFS transporter [Alphaproteobacteria bacterium]